MSILWSQGNASFEPITLEGADLETFDSLARLARLQLAYSIAGMEADFTSLGRDLYDRFFAGPVGQEVAGWLRDLAGRNEVESLEIASDAPGRIPWNLFEDIAQPGVWGRRFALSVGHRVNPLRTYPDLQEPRLLLVLDPGAEGQLDDAGRQALSRWLTTNSVTSVTDRQQLLEGLRQDVPDVIWILARVEKGGWLLGRDRVTAEEVQRVVASAEAGNSLPLVVSTAVGPADAAPRWECYLHAAASALPGLVASEVPLSAAQALDLGQSFLHALLQEGQPLAEGLRQVRQSAATVALAFSAFAPAQVRVLQPGQAEQPGPTAQPLPDEPFHPLRPLEREERALLLGRDNDIQECGILLDQPGACGLLIHGKSGAGKASLVRAGLAPYLEQENGGFLLLRDRTEATEPAAELDQPTLALRTGRDVAGTFAQGLLAFCALPYEFATPTGRTVVVDLPGILARFVRGLEPGIESAIQPGAVPEAGVADVVVKPVSLPSAAAVWERLRATPGALAELLDLITAPLPFELLIPIEQGEDLVALPRREEDGSPPDSTAEESAQILRPLALAAGRCKLIMTLRAEFFAEVAGLIRDETVHAWKDHFLAELTLDDLRDVLFLPTLREVPAYADDSPGSKYRMAYDPGVADKVMNAVRVKSADGPYTGLQLVQAIGASFFAVCRQRQLPAVRPNDAKEVLADDPVLHYLRRRLRDLPLATSSQRALENLYEHLAVVQPSGLVTRGLTPSSGLKRQWTGGVALEHAVNLAVENGPLLDVQQVLVEGREDLYLTAPQDALAVVGSRKIEERRRARYARSKVIDSLFITVPLIILGIAATYFFVKRSQSFGGGSREQLDPKVKAFIEAKEIDARFNRFAVYNGALARADQALRQGNTLRARQLLLSLQPGRDGNDLRGFEWFHLWQRANMEEASLLGHRAAVCALAISSDDALLASGDEMGAVHLWNLKKSGELVAVLKGLRTPVQALAFAADGKRVAAADQSAQILVWDVPAGDKAPVELEAKTRIEAKQVSSLAIVSETLAAASDNSITLWKLGDGKAGATLKEHTGKIAAIVSLPAGKGFASVSSDQAILWDAMGKKQASTKLTEVVATTAAVHGERLLIGGTGRKSGNDSGVVLVWDLKDGTTPELKARHGSGVLTLAGLPGDRLATGGKDSVVRVHDLGNGQEIHRLFGHLSWVRGLVASSDGARLASIGFDDSIKLWSAKTSLSPESIPAHDTVQALAFDARERVLASGGHDGLIKIWDPSSGAKLAELKAGGPVHCLAFAPEGNHLAAGVANDVRRWDVTIEKNEVKVKELAVLKRHQEPVSCVAYSADGQSLLSGSLDKTVVLWDTTAEKAVRAYPFPAAVTALHFETDLMLVGDAMGFARFVDRESGKLIYPPYEAHGGAIHALAVLDQGKTMGGGVISVSADQSVRLWAMQRESRSFTAFKVFRGHQQPVTCLAQGKGFFVTGGLDGTLKFGDLSLDEERFTLASHRGAVRSLALARSRAILASGGDDGMIRFHRSTPRPTYGPVNTSPSRAAQAGGAPPDEEP